MFLLFHLERPDVLSGGDLGIRKAMQIEYGLEEMPTPREVVEIGEPWRPHRSLASLYLWESLARGAGRPIAAMRLRFALGLTSPSSCDRRRLGGRRAGRPLQRKATTSTQSQRDEATRAAHQAEAVAGSSRSASSPSAAAFFQAEGSFSRHEFEVVATRCCDRGR